MAVQKPMQNAFIKMCFYQHADESIQRSPELAILAGSILWLLATTMPLQPTGF